METPKVNTTPEDELERLVLHSRRMHAGEFTVAAVAEDLSTFFEREWEPHVPFPD